MVDYNKVAERMRNAHDMMADSTGHLTRFVQYLKDFNLGDKPDLTKSGGDAMSIDLEAPPGGRPDVEADLARSLNADDVDGRRSASSGDAATLDRVIEPQEVVRRSQRGTMTRRSRRPFPFHS